MRPFKETESAIKFAKLLSASIENGKIKTTMALNISRSSQITIRLHRKKGEEVMKESIAFNFTGPKKLRQQILLINTLYADKTFAVDALIEIKDDATKEIIEQYQSEVFVLDSTVDEETETQQD